MAILLVIGIMDLRAMAAVAAAITVDGVVPKASVDQQVDPLASLRKLTDFASDETDH